MYCIADKIIDYQFIYPETAGFFEQFEISPEEGQDREHISVHTTPQMMKQVIEHRGGPQLHYSPRAEYEALASATSAALLTHEAFLFHSVGFIYRGKAIVYTGPSGIGKTTQYAQWKRNVGDEAKVISGDMPALSFQEDGSVRVCPSPWNGKERLRSARSAPLGGIIVLEQAKENTMRRLDPSEAILPIYSQMCLERREKEQIVKAFAAEDRLLRSVPVWMLSSRGDLDSAKLCRETIEDEIYG